MRHLVLTGDPPTDDALIAIGAETLCAGGLVAFPTETVYGLGAIATDEAAVARIFAAKGRPASDPLIVHVLESWSLDGVATVDDPVIAELIAAHWPGPLTVVVPKTAAIPDLVTAGLDHVALRAPSHGVARRLLAATGAPIAAPSANRFSYVSATTAAHVIDDLGDQVDVVIDGGPATGGIESTIVRVDPGSRLGGPLLVVLRHGALTIEDLVAPLAGPVEVIEPAADDERSASPGRLLRHYAPTTGAQAIASDATLDAIGGQVAYLGYRDRPRSLPPAWVFVELGALDDLAAVAHELYAVLRAVDAAGYDHLLLELTMRDGLGLAIDDRIRRAARATSS